MWTSSTWSTNAPAAASSSMTERPPTPDCAWNLSDLASVPQNGVKVMSTFACGGGSSMGYKRAGCTIVAANDIDPQMAKHYKRNLNPPHYFLCPIRDLLTADLPPVLYDLDILDGSPPCSTFSMAGSREKAWGKNKHFREGQAKQVLSDLFFDYLDLVERLKPRVAIAENVKGMLLGNAKGYTRMVMRRFKEIGYKPQLFLLNAADCGVPQKRERVFFVAQRADLGKPKLVLSPRHRWIGCAEGTADLPPVDVDGPDVSITDHRRPLWASTRPGASFEEANRRLYGKAGWFQKLRLDGTAPSPTLTACVDNLHHWTAPRLLSWPEYARLGSFPDDYWVEDPKTGKYMVGMSVPPKMTEQVARAVCSQWLDVEY